MAGSVAASPERDGAPVNEDPGEPHETTLISWLRGEIRLPPLFAVVLASAGGGGERTRTSVPEPQNLICPPDEMLC